MQGCLPPPPTGLARWSPGAEGLREQAQDRGWRGHSKGPQCQGLSSSASRVHRYVSPHVQKGTHAPPHPPGALEGNMLLHPSPRMIWRPRARRDNVWTGRGTPGSPQTGRVHPRPAGSPGEVKGQSWPCLAPASNCIISVSLSRKPPQKSFKDPYTDTIKPMQLS